MKRNKWAKKTAWMLVLLLVLSLMPTSIQAEAKSRKTKLNNTKIILTVGKSKKIKLLNNSKKVKWSTSNKKIVKITKKSKKYVKVKALKAGTAKITAKVGTKKYTCKVTVKPKKGFFSTTEETTENPKNPTTEAMTEASKDPTTEKKTEEKTESTEKPTTGETTEKPADPSEGTDDPAQRYTRLKWVELLLDSVGTKVITEDAVSKDPNGNALYSYVDLEEGTSNLTVETAVQQGILIPSEGQEEDVFFFHPEELTTREFAAVTAARAMGYLESGTVLECADQESLEYPLWDAVAVNIGLIELKEGSFKGKEELTGAEANQMLAKIKKIKAEENAVPEKVVDIQYTDDLVKDSVAGLTDYLVTETEIGYQITINNYTGTIEETGIEAGRPIFLPADKYGKYPDGFVCRVADAGIADGQINISGTPVESPFEVMDSFQLSGTAIIDEIVLGDGVTVKNEESMESRLSANPEDASDGLTEEEMDSKLGDIEITLRDDETVLEYKINAYSSVEVELKKPQLIYDINTSKKKGDKKFKVVLSNQGTISLKGEALDGVDAEFELYRGTPIDIGGNFKITPILKIVAESSGSLSWTVDVNADVGVDIQKERRIISDWKCNLGGNYDFSVSAGPEVDVVFSWISKKLKVGSVKLGAGIKAESTTSSAADVTGGQMYCRENETSGYFVVGVGDTGEKTVLDELLDKADLSISREWTKTIDSSHYESRQSEFGPFTKVEKCTAAHNLHGAVLDKDGQKVKFDSIIIRSKENLEQEYCVDNRTEGYYTCRVPDGNYTIIAVWNGVIKVRKDITVDGDSYFDIIEGGIIDRGTGTGFSWTLTEDGNFECKVDETADMEEVYKVMHSSKLLKDIGIFSVYMYGTVGGQRLCGPTQCGLFYNMPNLVSVNLAELNISNVTDMSSMFQGCSSLTELDLSSFNTSKVTNMRHMFEDCRSLIDVDVSNFDTSNVTDMSYMFFDCSSLTELDLSNFDTSKVTDMSGMFSGCHSLTELDLSSFNTSKVTDMSGMFISCSSLTELNLSSFNTSNVANMSSMFSSCSSLEKLDLSSFSTSNVTDMSYMFFDCRSLIELDLSNFDTSNVTDMSSMFSGCGSLTELNLSSFNTSNVTDMSVMFGCRSLIELDLSNFDTSKVTDMSGMFSGCRSLTELDLSSFNTSNVADMRGMFYGCSSLEKLDLSSFNTSNVTDMHGMFSGCRSLIDVDVSNFVTSMETEMSGMFKDCHEEIIPSWYVDWCEYWSEYWNEDIS